MQLTETLNETLLSGAAAILGVVIFALPIYYVWKLVVFFRRQAIPHWPPIVCLSLWLLQWPFALVSAMGCMGGGCGDPARNWLEFVGILAYNLIPAYWLWRRSATKSSNK